MPDTMICAECWGAKRPGCGTCGGAGVVADKLLSPHFLLSELLASTTASRGGIPNQPTGRDEANLTRLCVELLEPIRAEFGAIHVNSGLRKPAVNKAVGGSDTSAHCFGWAGDVVPKRAKRRDVMAWLIEEQARKELKYDQVIFELTWVHIALFHPDGAKQRGEARMFFGSGQYDPYDPADARTA